MEIAMVSLWADRTDLPEFPALAGDMKTDVLVIGGGLTGLLCAWFLKEAGVDCALAEGGTICGWNTRNTTAKITAQHGLIYDKLLTQLGQERARMYLAANLAAVDRYRQLCEKADCDFEDRDSYVYSLNDQGRLERELTALSGLGFQAQFADALKLPFSVVGAVKFPRQAQFDPLKFAAFIAKELPIYEHTAVMEIRKKEALTDKGYKIAADQFIVATHFPIFNKHGAYFMKMYQQRSYVIALKNAADVDGMYVDEAENGLSFRNAGDLLLLGGGGHRTGKEGGCWQELRSFAGRFYPKAVEKYYWAAQDCITLDGASYIGQYSRRLPHVLVATGFNKWGMTSSMTAAALLTDRILGKENEYAPAFDPSRSMKKSQLAANGLEASKNLLTFTKKRCPHLGCALHWNAAEHSWDCACHGSRFGADGALLDNPATGGTVVLKN